MNPNEFDLNGSKTNYVDFKLIKEEVK